MMKLSLFVMADRVIIDRASNRMSIIDIFEGLRSSTFPVIIPKLAFVAASKREAGDPEEFPLSMEFSLDGNAPYMTLPLGLNFQTKMTTRAILMIEGFLIPSPGLFTAKLKQDDATLAQLAVEIGKADPPTPTVAETTNQS